MVKNTNPHSADRDRNLSSIIQTIQDDGPAPLIAEDFGRTEKRTREVGAGAQVSEPRKPKPEPASGPTPTPTRRGSEGAKYVAALLGILIAALLTTAIAGLAFYARDLASRIDVLARQVSAERPPNNFRSELDTIKQRLDRIAQVNIEIVETVEQRLDQNASATGRQLSKLEQQLGGVQQENSQQLIKRRLRSGGGENKGQTGGTSATSDRNATPDAPSNSATQLALTGNRSNPRSGPQPLDSEPGTSKAKSSSAPAPKLAKTAGGQWVISLIAVERRDRAEKLRKDFADKGVNAEIVDFSKLTSRGTLFGLRVGGFATRKDAESIAPSVKEKLRLDEVVVSKQ